MIRAAVYPLAAAIAMSATPSMAEWGAVAVNATTGHYGYSHRFNTRRDAAARAKAFCQQYSGGAAGCKVVLTTNSCGGVARAGRAYYVAKGSGANRAGAKAMAKCTAVHGSACELARKFCAANN